MTIMVKDMAAMSVGLSMVLSLDTRLSHLRLFPFTETETLDDDRTET